MRRRRIRLVSLGAMIRPLCPFLCLVGPTSLASAERALSKVAAFALALKARHENAREVAQNYLDNQVFGLRTRKKGRIANALASLFVRVCRLKVLQE